MVAYIANARVSARSPKPAIFRSKLCEGGGFRYTSGQVGSFLDHHRAMTFAPPSQVHFKWLPQAQTHAQISKLGSMHLHQLHIYLPCFYGDLYRAQMIPTNQGS